MCWALLLSLPHDGKSQSEKKKPPMESRGQDAFGDPLPLGAVARIGTTRYRNAGNHGAVMSPDGRLLATIDNGNEITIRELPAWKIHRVIDCRSFDKNDPPQFLRVAFSGDSRNLFALDDNRLVLYVLDVATGMAIKKVAIGKTKLNSYSMQYAVSRDQKTFVRMICPNGMDAKLVVYAQVWDLATSNMRKAFEIPFLADDKLSGNLDFDLSADGRWLALNRSKDSSRAYYIEIWNLTAGKAAREIETEVNTQFKFSPDGRWLAATNGSTVLRLYDVASGEEKHNIRLRRAGLSLCLQFAPDAKSLWIADDAGNVQQWDHVAGELMATFKGPRLNGYVGQFGFTPAGRIMMLAELDVVLTLWDAASGRVFSPLNVPTSTISDLIFSDKGELFMACLDGSLTRWNPRTSAKLQLQLEDGTVYEPGVSQSGTGRFYRDSRNNVALAINGFTSLSKDGKILIAYEDAHSFFDAKSGKLLYEDDTLKGDSSIRFFDGDTKAASINNKKIRIWNARTGRDLAQFDLPLNAGEQACRFAVSPAGNQFAINTAARDGSGRTVLWDTTLKKIVREWTGQDRAGAMEFSPDHQWFAIAAAEQRLHLTRVGFPDSDFKLTLPSASDDITALAFSPDGRQLACTAGIPAHDQFGATVIVISPDVKKELESRILIYEVASKKIRLVLAGHRNGTIASLAYARDSGLLASGSSDTTALIWRAGLRAYAESDSGNEVAQAQLAAQFKLMGDADAKIAFQAMIQLAQTPTQTVPLLDAKFVPAENLDLGGKTIGQWIDDLSKIDFAVRTNASAMLKKMGPAAEPELRAATSKAKDPEKKRRLEELLNYLASRELTQHELQHVRAIEVLEAIATPEARTLLSRWARGGAGAVLTVESRKALERLNRDSKSAK